MAEKEDIRKRIKELNPEALPLIDKANELLRLSGSTTVPVIILEGMTEEEQFMATLAAVLKEGFFSGDAALAEAEKRFDIYRKAMEALQVARGET